MTKRISFKIPPELHKKLLETQAELKKMGINASLMDSGRVMAKAMEQKKVVILVQKRRKKRGNFQIQ